MTDRHLTVLQQMHACRAAFVDAIQHCDRNTIVYAGSPAWRICDVLVHVAFWEVEGCKSLMAHARHAQYATPDYAEARVDTINALAYAHLVHLPMATQLQYATDCRDAFVRALATLDADAFQRPIACPWAQHAPVATFLTHMYEHERDHLNDVLSVLKVSQ